MDRGFMVAKLRDIAGLKVSTKLLLAIFTLALTLIPVTSSFANDLPLAAGSPLVGFTFDDKPLLLPLQRNFQMAMLTASSELGRSCGRMESYGWRMNSAEQQRVEQIFTGTVDRLRGLGYVVEAKAPPSVSQDVTMFTADRANRHFIFMWSAGEIGLVMVLCESSSPIGQVTSAPPISAYPPDVMQSRIDTPAETRASAAALRGFSPVGEWVGNYTCHQSYAGATLDIARMSGENFHGTFRFYPTPKNRNMPTGRYEISGQYDRASQRILINPGKWLVHPKGYLTTVMVGSFDPVARSFSAYFQGVTGCTSFEAKSTAKGYPNGIEPPHKKRHVKKVEKAPDVTSAAPLPDIHDAASPTALSMPAAPDAKTPTPASATETIPTSPATPPATPPVPAPPPAPTAASVAAPTTASPLPQLQPSDTVTPPAMQEVMPPLMPSSATTPSGAPGGVTTPPHTN